MSQFLGIVLFIGFMVALWYIRKGMRKGFDSAWNNTIQRGANDKGKRLIQQRLTFTANAPIESVRNAVLSSVKVEPEQPKVIGGVYLAGASDTRLVYDLGSKLQTNFRGALQLTATPTGTRGSWEITNWLENGGLVTGRDVMDRLIAQINTGLRSVDPNARLQ